MNFYTAGDSSVKDGKFVPGRWRNLVPMTLKIDELPFTLEDFYFNRDKVNEYLKTTYNLPAIGDRNDLKFELADNTPIYKNPNATQTISNTPIAPSNGLPRGGYMFCTWLNEPLRLHSRCPGVSPVCQGLALCEGNGKFIGAPPPAEFKLSCEGSYDGCPSAIDCFRASKPQDSICSGGVSRSSQDNNNKNSNGQNSKEVKGVR